MKKGKTLSELAAEITRQQNSKKDFIVPAKDITSFVNNGAVEIGFMAGGEAITSPITHNGHIQLASYCDIPKRYYDTMNVGHQTLLTNNVNHWLKESTDARMVRMLDGNTRAFLSDKYKILDNFELAHSVLPMLYEANAEIESCEITENKIYIKAITHKVQAEINTGDVVSAGIIISNSETGNGSLAIKPMIYRLVCKNGAIADDYKKRYYHAGKRNELQEIDYSSETMMAEGNAFWLKVRDLVKFSLNEVTFDKIVNTMRQSTEIKIENPAKAIELVSKRFSFSEQENSDVLKHLIEGGDLSSWGLGNAVTRTAQDVFSYDRSTELEAIGYNVMQQNWN